MKVAKAVIGAAFGDEGKGLMTDFLASADTIVCRYNGGAQAGHTVQMSDGRRHVFHHFGSGSFRGAPTYLSRFFVSNPILYATERRALHAYHLDPILKVDRDGLVTTPYDMMINQLAEETRGDARHGSCGSGINETIVRSQDNDFRLTVWDLHNPMTLAAKLRNVRLHWVPLRIEALGLPLDSKYQAHFLDDGIQNHFVDDAGNYYRSIDILTSALTNHADIIFEGAQGLLLDENHAFFPHVTRSSTGLKNILNLAAEAQIDALDVTYVTRAYTTRHGVGPFPHEQEHLYYTDRTNRPNDWQGSLRFGHLDLDLIGAAIKADMRLTTMPTRSAVAVTCVNQIGNEFWYWHKDSLRVAPVADLRGIIGDVLDLPVTYLSDGPSAEDVHRFSLFQ